MTRHWGHFLWPTTHVNLLIFALQETLLSTTSPSSITAKYVIVLLIIVIGGSCQLVCELRNESDNFPKACIFCACLGRRQRKYVSFSCSPINENHIHVDIANSFSTQNALRKLQFTGVVCCVLQKVIHYSEYSFWNLKPFLWNKAWNCRIFWMCKGTQLCSCRFASWPLVFETLAPSSLLTRQVCSGWTAGTCEIGDSHKSSGAIQSLKTLMPAFDRVGSSRHVYFRAFVCSRCFLDQV